MNEDLIAPLPGFLVRCHATFGLLHGLGNAVVQSTPATLRISRLSVDPQVSSNFNLTFPAITYRIIWNRDFP